MPGVCAILLWRVVLLVLLVLNPLCHAAKLEVRCAAAHVVSIVIERACPVLVTQTEKEGLLIIVLIRDVLRYLVDRRSDALLPQLTAEDVLALQKLRHWPQLAAAHATGLGLLLGRLEAHEKEFTRFLASYFTLFARFHLLDLMRKAD